ncbi:MAG: SDR family oxidoreductase [Parvibaculum sp.]|uniref:SDR family oxidoreductase n=1 Tax=Parvibaculum sp. TaxID=2024848 RepID=UPI0025E4A768|nr:SDR family oxidoreductase [Parvibaculum sp.]MCE9648456.1 SDR family oxidoreductase [Parvibaculum sp.]
MDLGLSGRKAIICASSRGLGKACAAALAREGVDVVINGRDVERLEIAAKEISRTAKGAVTPVAADINTAEGRAKLISACPQADILVNNNEGPPPGAFQQWDETQWQAALDANLLAPVFMIKALIEGMKQRRFGRIVNITSAMVKAPRSPMGLSTAARSGLTAICKGLSVDAAPFNVTINNMLPERFDTDRQKQMAELAMAFKKITYEEARAEIAQSIAAKRMGDPAEFGDACAFLCSAQAGFISGQNLQLDGGSYPGLI